MNNIPLDNRLGEKLTEIRLEKGYSQRKLAQLANLTNTAISSIEHGKVSPSINTLYSILFVLDTNLSDFFSSYGDVDKRKIRVKVTRDELINIGNDNVSLALVHNGNPSRKLGFMIETYQPTSQTEEKISHEGEEAGTVIQGKITINLGEVTYHLEAGDSYVIDTGVPHTFINESEEVTKIISAHTPTTY